MILQFPTRKSPAESAAKDAVSSAEAIILQSGAESDDPIFAVLEQYRAARDAFDAFDGDEEGPQNAALERAYFKTVDPCFETVPTTLAGMKAKISFFMNDPGLREGLTDSETNELLHDFLNTLYKSACIIAGVS